MLEYILTQVPVVISGTKKDWLMCKMSPHSPPVFINKIMANGIETNQGFFEWDKVSEPVLQTIYQRLKLLEFYKNKNHE